MTLYHDLTQCSFLCRVNRFIARCLVNGTELSVHVKNTGRLGELLVPGALCYLEKASQPGRKTAFDLVAVEKDGRIVNIDSQAPNLIAREWVEQGGFGDVTALRSEVTYGDSRFDLAYWRTGASPSLPPSGFIEVKGVTLFDDAGLSCFPDAPTSRGVKHLHGLIRCREEGFHAYAVFMIQMEGVKYFEPNRDTHPEFASALRQAAEAGVHMIALDCKVTEDSLIAGMPVEIRL